MLPQAKDRLQDTMTENSSTTVDLLALAAQRPDQAIIIGAGLAGSEAAWQLANAGVMVQLIEMRPVRETPAHHTDKMAELVCSNSFRSDDHEHNAVGLIHHEMRQLNSLIMACGDRHAVPAGGALAVDREAFSADVTAHLKKHTHITLHRGEVTHIPTPEDVATLPHPCPPIIVATGPLTSDALSQSIISLTGTDQLAFFDAIAPIVYKDSIDMDICWMQSRYDKGEGDDYINCPMTKDEYEAFLSALRASDTLDFKEWEKDTPYFEGCMPIEIMASRGDETLRFGPMKPVGLTNPHFPEGDPRRKPHAVVQLRQDNKLGTLYNIVGFQTKMRYGSQKDVLRLIPGLGEAEFARLGGLHRNTFIKSPVLLDRDLSLKSAPHIRFAGQITGCEGYIESACVGLMAGRFAAAQVLKATFTAPPETTAFGALLGHITGGADPDTYQPMNVNFGLFPPVNAVKVLENGKKRKIKGLDRKRLYTDRAKADFLAWQEMATKKAA